MHKKEFGTYIHHHDQCRTPQLEQTFHNSRNDIDMAFFEIFAEVVRHVFGQQSLLKVLLRRDHFHDHVV
jgi:hypothetical protein